MTSNSDAKCLDCGLDYSEFPMDVLLPRAQWLAIHPDEHGLLCAACIVRRCAKLPNATCVHAIVEIANTKDLGRCDTCEHLKKFDATKEYFNCPVVNIRVHETQIAEFGCTLWEAKCQTT